MDPDPKASARYVVRYRRPVEMPGSPLGFFTTELFSARAKWAVLKEPFVPARRDGKEESVAEFVIRRLGQEFLDHAIDALVAGVYAGTLTSSRFRRHFRSSPVGGQVWLADQGPDLRGPGTQEAR